MMTESPGVRFGDVVVLKHDGTFRHLTSIAKLYVHAGSSRQQAVVCRREPDAESLWKIIPPLDRDSVNKDDQVVCHGDTIRLVHVSTGHLLHSHCHRAPVTDQQEVSASSAPQVHNPDDEWIVLGEDGNSWTYNKSIRLQHKPTRQYLHSHSGNISILTFNEQEVTCYRNLTDFNNDWFAISPVTLGLSNERLVRRREDISVFIGHGRSLQWRVLEDFLTKKLKLKVIEYNHTSVAGLSGKEVLQNMLKAQFAFLVMTPEDEQTDKSIRARENVVHEAGLFQGRLGFNRAIIIRDRACDVFSNLDGITELRFTHEMKEVFEEVRDVINREFPEAGEAST